MSLVKSNPRLVRLDLRQLFAAVHLLRLFSAGILWRQLLTSLLSFVQVCRRLIKEETAAAMVSLSLCLPSSKLCPSYVVWQVAIDAWFLFTSR